MTTCNTRRIADIIIILIFYCWKQLNPICTTNIITDTAIKYCGYNYRHNSEVMFPVTNVLDTSNESNCLSQSNNFNLKYCDCNRVGTSMTGVGVLPNGVPMVWKHPGGFCVCFTMPESPRHYHIVLGKSCSQAKHTAVHVLPGQKMPLQVLPRQQMPKATFSQPYITIYVPKKTDT